MSNDYNQGGSAATMPSTTDEFATPDLDDEEMEREAGHGDLTHGETPAQILADDETRSPEEEGGDNPQPDR